jgi:SAM-dependent methyltransferase
VNAQFDSHADSYRREVDQAIAFSGKDVGFFAERKAQVLADLTAGSVGDPERLSVLDVGCGIGLVDGHLAKRFGSVSGVDVSASELAVAREQHPGVSYALAEEDRLPHDGDTFDVVFAACVLHHVAVDERLRFVGEMHRVVRPGGLIVVFEHNPLNPLTRLVVRRIAFDAGVRLLRAAAVVSLLEGVGMGRIQVVHTTFLPFRTPLAQRLEERLGWLPLGAQYAVAGRKGDA